MILHFALGTVEQQYQKVFFLDQRVVYLITFNNDRNFYDTLSRRFVVLNNIVNG